MDHQSLETIRAYLQDSRDVISAAIEDERLQASMVDIGEAIVRSMRAGGKLLLAGNGGSAADAQHIAGEFLSRLNYDRAPLPAIALTVDTSVLTAVGNDYGYDQVFRRQVLGLGRAGDVLVGITTSGRSPNILSAMQAAREAGLATVGFTGSGGIDFASKCDLALVAPTGSTPLIQQFHIMAAHIICTHVESSLFPRAAI